jgi:hypothetical protein
VDVSTWKRDDENPIFPGGSQPKQLMICPDPPPTPQLIGGRGYILKVPIPWKANQVWSELIASEFGRAIGVPVPRCFVSQADTGELGALVEFFYEYPHKGGSHQRFIHGSDILQRFIVNKKLGKPHSIRINLRVCRRYGVSDAVQWWAKTLAFDALIGNTDRHPDNWGLLVSRTGSDLQYGLSPAFDNGTSLGYELPESKIAQAWSPTRIETYVSRGTHHVGWTFNGMTPGQHAVLCNLFAQAFPSAGYLMRDMLRFDAEVVRSICARCQETDVLPRFTAARSAFVSSLIEVRRVRLAAALGL